MQNQFDETIKHHNDVTVHRREAFEKLLKSVPNSLQEELRSLFMDYGDHAYELGKFRAKKEAAETKVPGNLTFERVGPAFSFHEGSPDVIEHKGRHYINGGRPGFNTRVNNSIGYSTAVEARQVMDSYKHAVKARNAR